MTKMALATMASVKATCRAMRNAPALRWVSADRMCLTGMAMSSSGFQLPCRLDSGGAPDRIRRGDHRHDDGKHDCESHGACVGVYDSRNLCFEDPIKAADETECQQNSKKSTGQTNHCRFHKILRINCTTRGPQRPP